MTPTERLQAAIEKLEALQAQTTQAPWSVVGGEVVRDAGGLRTIQSLWVADIDPTVPDADLIVTLHRTIDAQLAILRDGRDVTTREGIYLHESAVALADAILGGA